MGVKPRTVKTHLARVFALLGIHEGHKLTKLAALLNQHRPGEPIPLYFRFAKSIFYCGIGSPRLKNNEVARVLGTTECVVTNYLGALYDASGM
jgi:hypothetical protein